MLDAGVLVHLEREAMNRGTKEPKDRCQNQWTELMVVPKILKKNF